MNRFQHKSSTLKLLFISCLSAGILLASCEGPKYFSVTVIDKQTKKPIDSVTVQVKVLRGKKEQQTYDLQGYTDSTGKFESSIMIGTGLSPARFDFQLEYEKSGYIHKSELNNTNGVVELYRK